VDPSGQFAYVANGDAGTLSVFQINILTGALTVVGAPVSSIIIDGGPSAIAIE
jgi:DNA-binding beta-propeller fold protein YncE